MNLNQATTISEEELKGVMTYHPWTDEMIEKGDKVRSILGEAIKVIIENIPPSQIGRAHV